MGGIIGKLSFDRHITISHATVRLPLQALWDEHQGGADDHTHRFWSLLMLEFWVREFIDGDAAAEPAGHAVLVRAA